MEKMSNLTSAFGEVSPIPLCHSIIDFFACSNSVATIFTIAVLMGEDKAVVTRGCTALDDENLYKCDMHSAGNQVDVNVTSKYPSFARFSPSATATEMAAIKTGTLQERKPHLK